MRRVEAQRRATSKGGGLWSWLAPLLTLALGLAIGLYWAWMVQPLENTTPNMLTSGGQATWVEMAADSLALSGDADLARTRLSFFEPAELDAILRPRITQAEAAGDLPRQQRLTTLAQLVFTPTSPSGEVPTPAPEPTGGSNVGPLLIGCGALGLLGALAVLATRMRQSSAAPSRPARTVTSRNRATTSSASDRDSERPSLSPPPAATPVATGEMDLDLGEDDEDDDLDLDLLFRETEDAVNEAGDEPVRELEFVTPPPTPAKYSPALDEFVTRYNHGDDGYDMSFSVETPQTEFLGECGVGISDTLAAGSPQKVTAFEVWLFDKDDIRTVTKVLLSDYAWENEELRSRLAPKGELIHAKAGDIVDLETKSLRVRARIREVEYGDGGPADNSYFDRLVVELTPQQKS